MELEKISTSELVQELQKRIGVESVIAEPYEKKDISVEGPAIVLLITD